MRHTFDFGDSRKWIREVVPKNSSAFFETAIAMLEDAGYEVVISETKERGELIKKVQDRCGGSIIEPSYKLLVKQSLPKLTNQQLHNLIKTFVEKAIAESKDLALEEAAEKLYGLSAADFKELVLVPSAEKDLLLKHYEYNQTELEALWNDLSKNAEVKIYYPGYEWKDG